MQRVVFSSAVGRAKNPEASSSKVDIICSLHPADLPKSRLAICHTAHWPRYRQIFFVEGGHEIKYASNGNKYFSLYHVIIRPTKFITDLR